MFGRKKLKETSKYQRFTNWSSQNRIRSAILVFVCLIGLAGVYSSVMMFFNQDENKAALNEEESKILSQIPSWWYSQYFKTLTCEIDACQDGSDPDHDGLTNAQEFYYRSDPTNNDTNKNGTNDGDDVAKDIDPSLEGNVTFDYAASDENIFGESLVFNTDIKKMINEMVDPNKVILPGIEDKELKISQDNSPEAIAKYFTEAMTIISRDLPKDPGAFIGSAIQSANENSIQQMRVASTRLIIDMKNLEVPREALNFHKYIIIIFSLIPDVMVQPPPEVLNDEYNEQGNAWYEKARAYASVMQKLDLEVRRLQGPR
jgi:hypothetical protein